MAERNCIHKAARIAYLSLCLLERKRGRPPKHEFNTVELARRLGVSQRSIQRDLHYAWQVKELVKTYQKGGSHGSQGGN